LRGGHPREGPVLREVRHADRGRPGAAADGGADERIRKEGREVGAVRDVEDRAERGLDERDDVQLLDAQGAGDRRRRDREEKDGADRVRADHQRSAAGAVDQGTGEQPDEQHGRGRGRDEDAHLERGQ
jgi:hypothetical protein